MKSIKRNSLKTILFTGLGLIVVTAAFAAYYGQPDIRINGYSVDFVDSDEVKVTVKCEVTDDGGSPVTHFLGDVKYCGDDRWTYSGIRDADFWGRNKYDYEFKKLVKSRKEADFRVRSATEYEMSDPAEIGPVVFL